MTRKEQNKISDAKIESNINQYKVDRLNTEISAFSSGDLNKYEFLKRIDLNYKPNALDKARGSDDDDDDDDDDNDEQKRLSKLLGELRTDEDNEEFRNEPKKIN